VKKLLISAPYRKIALVFSTAFCLLYVSGCNPPLSSPEQLKRFENAGPITSRADTNDSSGTKFRIGPYRVVPGDVLELQMPAVLRMDSSKFSNSLQEIEPYLCRVNNAGSINLPIIGEMAVEGKTLIEIESKIVDAYYPAYVVTPPAVVCRIKEFEGENTRVFTVIGLVEHPDTFPYPPNVQYNLMEALAFAGGLDPVADPRYVKIYRKNANGEVISATFGIGGKFLADAYNVAIKPGDVVYVDHTLSTRANTFLSNVLTIGVGADVRFRKY
jgi:polysaccharide export outer membrane protein